MPDDERRRLTSNDIVGDRLDLLSDHYINSNMYREEDVAAAVNRAKSEIERRIVRDGLPASDDTQRRRKVSNEAFEAAKNIIDEVFPAVGEPDGESDNQGVGRKKTGNHLGLEAATPLIPATTIVKEMDRMERNGVAAAWQKLRNKLRGDTDE